MRNKIDLVILDVDGTLTDGGIYIDNNGKEFKKFNVKDGYGILNAQKQGVEFIIITGRTSNTISIRAKELNIQRVFQGITNKESLLKNILKKEDFKITLYIGDDLNDLDAMKLCNFIACPKDSTIEVLNLSNYVSKYNGGSGAVRDIIDNFIIPVR